MEQYIKDQITYGLKYLPKSLVKYNFIEKSSYETEKMKKAFIRGVCHPNENYSQLKDASVEWVRIDIPFPFNNDGSLSEAYINFKKRAKGYRDNGIKIMAVTPYPSDFIEYGADIRTEQGTEKVREIARFLINDMQGFVNGFQVTNEMGIPRFTLPFTMSDAVKFIGVQLKEMYPYRKDIILGYNCAGPQADLHVGLKEYYGYCDYIGIDIYMGCFFFGTMNMFDALLNYLWAMTKKPIIVQEFGYISGGKPKTAKEKSDVLKKYGAENEKEAKDNIESFVENLNPRFKEYTKRICNNDKSRYYDFLFHSDMKDHLYCELPKTTVIPGYEHTPEGQAEFYKYILNHLYNKPFVAGTIIYCYQDSEKCYICGQSDCPVETRWGLVDLNGEPKPSYYAVKEEYTKIKEKSGN